MFKVILPAAGYGTRVAADYINGKELMPDPQAIGAPLIRWAIVQSIAAGAIPVVITRETKTGLIEYISSHASEVSLLTLPEAQLNEWPTTCALSEPIWAERNVMVLPDTRFSEPEANLRALDGLLEFTKYAFGVIPLGANEMSKFACLCYAYDAGTNQELVLFAEKPSTLPPLSDGSKIYGIYIICLVGFKREVGEDLFAKLACKGCWWRLQLEDVSHLTLNWFKDIARNGKVEEC